MLRKSGISVLKDGLAVTLKPGVPQALDVRIPGDFSSAAFFIAAALMCPGSRVTISYVGLNPTRTAFLRLVEKMGADISFTTTDDGWEPAGDITVKHSGLRGIEVSPEDVAEAVDEVTLVALLATAAEGRTAIRGAAELRHKESDRISGAVAGLKAMGARIDETPDGMEIAGPTKLRGARVSSFCDHRVGMMMAVAGLAADGETVVEGWEWTRTSYPGFEDALGALAGEG
jgi:3-phosphoshikimate 1-carboxyvinyltransferase